MNQKQNREFDLNKVQKDFTSDFVPVYNQGIFHMKNYTMLRANSDIVYSNALCIEGIHWRLKVYPNGNGASEG